MISNYDNNFDQIRIYIPYRYRRFIKPFIVPKHLNKYKKVKILRCNPDFGPSSKFIFPVLYDNEIMNEDKIFILDDDSYKTAGWFNILNNELDKNKNSIVQLNYGKYIIPQIHGATGFCFFKKTLNTKNFRKFFLNLPLKLLFIDDDMLSYYLYKYNIKIYRTNKTVKRIYLNSSNALHKQNGSLNRKNLRNLAISFIKKYKYKSNFPFNYLI